MNARGRLGILLLALLPTLGWADDYSGMLGYLDRSHVGGRALAGAQGVIAINQAAGDFNVQANLHGMAQGGRARVVIAPAQRSDANRVLAGPMQASAQIDGLALQGASGIASINQASGTGNTTLNVVQAALASEGIRESDDAALAAASVTASAGGQGMTGNGSASGTRSAGVAASALQGFEGVLQLNQIAGSGNDTANILSMAVQGNP